MPRVHIDPVEDRSDEQLAVLADTVYQAARDAFAAPEDDRYIIITEHKPGRMAVVAQLPPGVLSTSPPVVLYSSQCVLSRQSVMVARVGSVAGVRDVT